MKQKDIEDTLPYHVTDAQSSASTKPYYEHPVDYSKQPRLTAEEYAEVPEHKRKYIHSGAKPYGHGYNMSHHGEGKPYGK